MNTALVHPSPTQQRSPSVLNMKLHSTSNDRNDTATLAAGYSGGEAAEIDLGGKGRGVRGDGNGGYGFYQNTTDDHSRTRDSGLVFPGTASAVEAHHHNTIFSTSFDAFFADDHHHGVSAAAAEGEAGSLTMPYSHGPVEFEDSQLYEGARFEDREYDYEPQYHQHHHQHQHQDHLSLRQKQPEEMSTTESAISSGGGGPQTRQRQLTGRHQLQLQSHLLTSELSQQQGDHQDEQQDEPEDMDLDEDEGQEQGEESEVGENVDTDDDEGDLRDNDFDKKRKSTWIQQQRRISDSENEIDEDPDEEGEEGAQGQENRGADENSGRQEESRKQKRRRKNPISNHATPRKPRQQLSVQDEQSQQQRQCPLQLQQHQQHPSSSSFSVSSPSSSAHRSNFITEQRFLLLAEDYLLSLSPKKREKALLSNSMYQKILMVLIQPKNTQVSTAQFRFWAKKMFTLSATPTHHVVCHGGKPVATKECLYDVLVYCHRKSSHGGRDKTSAEVRLHYSWVPKELIARFVKHCPLCLSRRSTQQRQGQGANSIPSTMAEMDSPDLSALEQVSDTCVVTSFEGNHQHQALHQCQQYNSNKLDGTLKQAPQEPSQHHQNQQQPNYPFSIASDHVHPSLLHQGFMQSQPQSAQASWPWNNVARECSSDEELDDTSEQEGDGNELQHAKVGECKDMGESLSPVDLQDRDDRMQVDEDGYQYPEGDPNDVEESSDDEQDQGHHNSLIHRERSSNAADGLGALEHMNNLPKGMVGITQDIDLSFGGQARYSGLDQHLDPEHLQRLRQQQYPFAHAHYHHHLNPHNTATVAYYHHHQQPSLQQYSHKTTLPIVPVAVHPNGHILHDRHPIHNRARIMGLATTASTATTATPAGSSSSGSMPMSLPGMSRIHTIHNNPFLLSPLHLSSNSHHHAEAALQQQQQHFQNGHAYQHSHNTTHEQQQTLFYGEHGFGASDENTSHDSSNSDDYDDEEEEEGEDQGDAGDNIDAYNTDRIVGHNSIESKIRDPDRVQAL